MAIIGIQTGKSNTEDAQEKGVYPLFDRSQVIKRSNKYLFDGEYVIVAGEGNFKPKYYNGKFDLHQRAYCLKSMNTEVINNKYLYYLVLKNYQIFSDYSVGSTVPSLRLSSFSWIEKTIFPSVQEQQKIIDIIEPVEKMINSLNSSKERVISLISKIGELSILLAKKSSSIKFEKQKEKYIESGNYVSTGNIGDFNNVIEKVEELTSTPTRARLQFKKDILYISKLDGEKKILYLNKSQDLILSNGMWGIEGDKNSKYSLYAFLMSDTFYEEKKMKSTGTTMRGLNDKTLNRIIDSYSISMIYNVLLCKLFLLLSESAFLLEKLIQIKNNSISLLIN